jgi:pimeloyl-ACP methyl ester carboxylesterase
MDPVGASRAIREVVRDAAVSDLSALGDVRAPALVIAREGDSIHPASVARRLATAIPNTEAIVLASEADLFASIPMLVDRVSGFLSRSE